MAIKNNKDIPAGAIVTSEKGHQFLVLVDDAGQRGLFTKSGTWHRFDGDSLTFAKGSKIQTIQAFDTLPPLDAISEGVKLLYTGRASVAPLSTVYTAKSLRVLAAEKAIADARSAIASASQVIADAERIVARG